MRTGKVSYTRALYFLVIAGAAGTMLSNRIALPSGRHWGALAPLDEDVTRIPSPPFKGRMYIWAASSPSRLVENASRVESGEKTGLDSAARVDVRRRAGALPSAGTTHKSTVCRAAS